MTIDDARLNSGAELCLQLVQAVAGDVDPDSPLAWVLFASTAADEAYHAVMADPPHKPTTYMQRLLDDLSDGEMAPPHEPLIGSDLAAAALEAASVAYCANMPKLVGRKAVQGYIACIAHGLAKGYIGGGAAKTMLYGAQVALTAYRSRQKRRA